MYFVAVPTWLMSIWMFFQYMWMTLCFNIICQFNRNELIINFFSFLISQSQLFRLFRSKSKLSFLVFNYWFLCLREKAIDNFNCVHFLPGLPIGRICFFWIDFSRAILAKVRFALWAMMEPKFIVVDWVVTFVTGDSTTVIVTRTSIKLLAYMSF